MVADDGEHSGRTGLPVPHDGFRMMRDRTQADRTMEELMERTLAQRMEDAMAEWWADRGRTPEGTYYQYVEEMSLAESRADQGRELSGIRPMSVQVTCDHPKCYATLTALTGSDREIGDVGWARQGSKTYCRDHVHPYGGFVVETSMGEFLPGGVINTPQPIASKGISIPYPPRRRALLARLKDWILR